jgi:hypothetical protein
MWMVAAAVLVFGAAWFLVTPLGESVLSMPEVEGLRGARTALLDAKERAVRALKDLELDFAMGKMSAEDFEQGKRGLTLEVAGILKELKADEGR